MGKQTTVASATRTVAAPAATKNVAATFGSVALQQLAKKGAATATVASHAVTATVAKPTVATLAPVGQAVHNASLQTHITGLPVIGMLGCKLHPNGRTQPAAGTVTANIWQAALMQQLAGTVPTGKSIAAVLPTANANSCGLGLTQYWAYTGQQTAKLAPAALAALATAPLCPVRLATLTAYANAKPHGKALMAAYLASQAPAA